MDRRIPLALGVLGGVLLLAAAGLYLSIDADCPAQGAYGNYCGIREWAWSLILTVAALPTLAAALVLHRRAQRAAA